MKSVAVGYGGANEWADGEYDVLEMHLLPQRNGVVVRAQADNTLSDATQDIHMRLPFVAYGHDADHDNVAFGSGRTTYETVLCK